MTKSVLLVPNANSRNGAKALLSSDNMSTLTFGGIVDSSCVKGNVWKNYIANLMSFLYPTAKINDLVPKIYFGTDCTTSENVWIKYTKLDGDMEFNEKHRLLNTMVVLYEGLEKDHLTRGNSEKVADIEAMLRKTPDRYKHGSKVVVWKEVASNSLFDLEISTKRMINLMGVYLREEKYSMAVGVMNVLGLKFDNVVDGDNSNVNEEILPDDPQPA